MAEVVCWKDFKGTLTKDLVKALEKQLGFSLSSLNGALPIFRRCSSGSNIKVNYVKWSLCWKSEHHDFELILCCLWNAEWAKFAKAKMMAWLYVSSFSWLESASEIPSILPPSISTRKCHRTGCLHHISRREALLWGKKKPVPPVWFFFLLFRLSLSRVRLSAC